MTVVTRGGDYIDRPRANGLADVLDVILDKGLVIDAFVRVSLLGLELLTIDARIVIASVDTYLRFAEAVDRVVLAPAPSKSLGDIVGGGVEGGARRKVRGIAEGAKDAIGIGGDQESGDAEPSQSAASRGDRR